MKDIEREAFEAWWDKDEGIDNAGPWAPDSPIQFAWSAWRAAVEANRVPCKHCQGKGHTEKAGYQIPCLCQLSTDELVAALSMIASPAQQRREPMTDSTNKCKTCDGAGGHEVAASSTSYFWRPCPDCSERHHGIRE
ncbi:MAG: hypothetical protein ACKO0Z_21945 [Betaproteobacteria bacterium]